MAETFERQTVLRKIFKMHIEDSTDVVSVSNCYVLRLYMVGCQKLDRTNLTLLPLIVLEI